MDAGMELLTWFGVVILLMISHGWGLVRGNWKGRDDAKKRCDELFEEKWETSRRAVKAECDLAEMKSKHEAEVAELKAHAVAAEQHAAELDARLEIIREALDSPAEKVHA